MNLLYVRISFACALWLLWTSVVYSSTEASTKLQMFHETVLKRRTRAVAFPKRSLLLFTAAFFKALVHGRPRGLLFSMEFDIYHPLPDGIEGWKPTIILNKIEREKQQEEKTKLEESLKASSVNVNSTTAFMDLDAVQHYDDHSNIYHYDFNGDADIYNPWPYYHSRIDAGTNPMPWQLQNPYIRQSSNAQSHIQRSPQRPYRRPSHPHYESGDYGLHQHRKENDAVWHHDQNYRERRSIFDQLETIGELVNINMKSCIQRAMCEITTHLKPYGESLMDDVIRIILT